MLNSDLVLEYLNFYNQGEESSSERFLFKCVSPAVEKRGEYLQEEFLQVCDWKTTRTRSLVRSNNPSHIAEITRMAFQCSDNLRVPVLSILRGVSTPTASALLTVWKPDEYTIIDFRVLSALSNLSHGAIAKTDLTRAQKSYIDYLILMKTLSESIGCDLRSLDKALWMFDKCHSKL